MEVVQNLVNGKTVATREGAMTPLVDPCTGQTYGSAPVSSAAGGRRPRPSAAWRCSGSPTRSSGTPTVSSTPSAAARVSPGR